MGLQDVVCSVWWWISGSSVEGMSACSVAGNVLTVENYK